MKTYTIYTFQVYSKKDGSNLEDFTEVKVISENLKDAKKRALKLLDTALRDRKIRLLAVTDYLENAS